MTAGTSAPGCCLCQRSRRRGGSRQSLQRERTSPKTGLFYAQNTLRLLVGVRTRSEDGSTGRASADGRVGELKDKFIGGRSLKSDKSVVILKRKNLSRPEGKAETVGITVIDVTAEYIRGAAPGQGAVTYDAGYRPGIHKNEMMTAKWLHRTFGGDIHVFDERGFDSASPDFLWREKLWELKNTSTANATDNAVKKAIKQIREIPGGIILNYGENEITDVILGVIKRRIERSRLEVIDVMLLRGERLVSIQRYRNEGR